MEKHRKTYAALGRLAHKVATPFLKLYMNENHVRVRALILDETEKEVLLVRSWLGHQLWSLPGGGVKRSEGLPQATAREAHEETGLRIVADQLQPLGTFVADVNSQYVYTTACFVIVVAKREPRIPHRRKLEILDMRWFALDKLPKDLSPTVTKALALR